MVALENKTDSRDLLYQPSKLFIESSQMKKFQDFIIFQYNLKLDGFEDLYKFSIDSTEKFWEAVWKFCKIISSKKYTSVLDTTVPIYQIPKWFQGARLNYAENLLRHSGNLLALISETENVNATKMVTFSELRGFVGRVQSHLIALGIVKGDRIVGLMPNCIETVVFMLATTSIGAIWSSASPDFGLTGILDRFKQIEPKLMVTVDAVIYNNKVHDNLAKLNHVVQGLPSLIKVVVVKHVSPVANVSNIPKAVLYDDFVNDFEIKDPVFEQVPFDHPLVILYSSGTTGVPKCIVHSHGGTLIQHLKEHIIHGNMNESDVFFYYTTTGWMMWNWLISGLATGATVVLYEGNPVAPSVDRLWRLIDTHGITQFGTSAKYLQNLEEKGFCPMKEFRLSTLKTIYSTGSSLKPISFDYIYSKIKKNISVGSITGGTDIISLFAGHNSIGPVYRGEIQCRCLGMAVEAWDENGCPVMDSPGDLVCTKPFPVMPVCFWNDLKGEKYQAAYFNQHRGVWYHGDFLEISSKTGGVMMLGRSDGTLNPAGVRFGSAELYNIMVEFPQVADSLAVGQNTSDGERVVLFLKMNKDQMFSTELTDAIKKRIRTLLSARHVPAVIFPISDIPYTLTGKKVEVAVKKIISGETVIPSSSLANPESLELFVIARSKL